jgi:hypothetical protein
LGAFIGGVHAAHQVGLATCVRVVGQRQPSHGPPERRRVGVWRHAEGFMPGERDFLEQDLDRFGRGLLQDRGDRDRPGRCGGATAGPVVDLARRVAGEACEGGLADVGAGEQGRRTRCAGALSRRPSYRIHFHCRVSHCAGTDIELSQ